MERIVSVRVDDGREITPVEQRIDLYLGTGYGTEFQRALGLMLARDAMALREEADALQQISEAILKSVD